tara:strand:+ start:172900 stop:173886 length:987 start_codon:yes stop_codon:yes gene_type:complete
VSNSPLIAVIGGAFALSLATFQPAAAQSAGQQATDPTFQPEASQEDNARRSRSRHQRPRAPQAPAAPAAPTPEELIASAQVIATSAGVACQVSEAAELGLTVEQEAVYEAACTTGPGYILIASTPAQAVDCVLLNGQANLVRATDPEADVGQQCALPANQNVVAVLQAYATEAGVDCIVDEASAIGKTDDGNLMYEVGCQNKDGYWLEKTTTGWTTTACWELIGRRTTCRFTPAAESYGAWKGILAGTTAAACDVQQTRLMGKDAADLAIYEIKCATGDGYLARVGADHRAQRIHTCAEAVNIGGGCQIGVAPAATTEDAPAAEAPAQ